MNPADAMLELAFNQAINSLRSFAGMVFLVKRTSDTMTSGEIGAKSFNKSYGSEYKICTDQIYRYIERLSQQEGHADGAYMRGDPAR